MPKHSKTPGVRLHGATLRAYAPAYRSSKSNVSVIACCASHATAWRAAALAANAEGVPHPGGMMFMECWRSGAPGSSSRPPARPRRKANFLTAHDLVDRFLESHQNEYDIGELTRARLVTITIEARNVKAFLPDNPAANFLDPDRIKGYGKWLASDGGAMGKGVAQSTQRGIIERAREIWKWGNTRGLVTTNPFSACKTHKSKWDVPKAHMPKWLKLMEIIRMMPRDWYVAGVMLFVLGLRRAELFNIRLCDIDIGRRMLRIRGQGGRRFEVKHADGTVSVAPYRDGTKDSRNSEEPVERVLVLPSCLIPLLLWYIQTFHGDLETSWADSDRPLIHMTAANEFTTVERFGTAFNGALEVSGNNNWATERRRVYHLHLLRSAVTSQLLRQVRQRKLDGSAVSDWLGNKRSSSKGEQDASNVTLESYWLGRYWDDHDPVERGLLLVANTIDDLIACQFPEGLLPLDDPRYTDVDWIDTTAVAEMLDISIQSAYKVASGILADLAIRDCDQMRRWLVPRSSVLALRAGDPLYVSVAVAAAELGLTQKRVYRLIAAGHLTAKRTEGNWWAIERKSLNDHIRTVGQAEAAASESMSHKEAALALGCEPEIIPGLVNQGHLVYLPGAPPESVASASVATFRSSCDNPFLVVADLAISLLGVTAQEFTAMVSTGELELAEGGFVTQASLSVVVQRRSTKPGSR